MHFVATNLRPLQGEGIHDGILLLFHRYTAMCESFYTILLRTWSRYAAIAFTNSNSPDISPRWTCEIFHFCLLQICRPTGPKKISPSLKIYQSLNLLLSYSLNLLLSYSHPLTLFPAYTCGARLKLQSPYTQYSPTGPSSNSTTSSSKSLPDPNTLSKLYPLASSE